MGTMGHFADEFTRALDARSIRKYALWKLSGVSQGLLSRYQSGHQVPEADTIARLAAALNWSADALQAAADADRLGGAGLARLQQHVMAGKRDKTLPAGQNKDQVEHPWGNLVFIPVFGPVAAGGPMSWTPEHAISTMPLSPRDAEGVDGAFVVRGDSLSGRGICHGDRVLVRRLDGERPPNGKFVVVEQAGAYVCKVYRRNDLGEYLESHVAGQDPEPAPLTDPTHLVGLVVRVVKDV